MSPQEDWWASLNHGGLLIAPNKVQEAFGANPVELSSWRIERLRRELTRFDGSRETLSRLLDFVLEDLSELTGPEWQKAHRVDSRWAISGFTKEQIKPRRIWVGPNGETLPVFVPDTSAARQYGTRLGVGRSRRLLSRTLEWLRRMQQPVALITNGRQWRLVHAGQDYDAWCEWDIDLWFEEGQPSSQVSAWRRLVNRNVLVATKSGEPSTLVQSILDSRKGQSELSAVLGERVRQAVEELITASYASIEAAGEQDHAPDYRDLYIAGTRIVMRFIITLFAEARSLLPLDNRIYQQAYSIDGLSQQLNRRAGGRGSERLAQGRSAWPRLIALFKLIYTGSAHEALPVPQYSGDLFQPGRADSDLPIKRALALLEAPSNQITDKQVHEILRLLTRTKIRVRQGRRSTWVDGPVDFSALSSEYIGILYEGLLDYELKRADASDPVVFLNVGRQPALPLSRLESMDDKAIKQLFEEMKKKDNPSGVEDSDENPVENDELVDEERIEDEADAEGEDESPEEMDGATTDGDCQINLSVDDIERAQAWLGRATEIAGLVKKRRGKTTGSEAEFAEAKRAAGSKLCAKLVAPGQFYLVRWGGTRKGAGTFYTRPQLAGPTVKRTLQPLAFLAVQKEIDPRTGLEEIVEWEPRKPEEILDLKICDPAMGSGSFPVAALRYLTDALVQSLYHHRRIENRGDGSVARLADGQAATAINDQLLPLPPEHEAFEETLRAQLKRHVVERCIYGVDIDPLAVELGRMAMWVETMDRTLPFGFLDHKMKVGNSLVGAWFDTFQEYPAMAWEREGGDGSHDRFVHHFHDVIAKRGKNAGQTKRKGDVWAATISARKTDVRSQLIDILSGQLRLGEDEPVLDIRDELADIIEKLHALPVHDTEARAELYGEHVLGNPRYHALKARMDLWCALWFWPGDAIETAPMPVEFAKPSVDALRIAATVAEQICFFHWELEFPDVFSPKRTGFDAVVGNPPWEIQKPNSKEFFSNIDPLYRAYGKQDALGKQIEYFTNLAEDEEAWLYYNADLKARSNWVKYAAIAFGDYTREDKGGKRKHDLNLGGRGRKSFAESSRLHAKWRKWRQGHPSFAGRTHPFLHQGSADLNTYKMFLEQSHALLREEGRLGMLVPSGIYTDKGSTNLRELFLGACDWQWLFGFENRLGIFDIDGRFKFCPVIIQKGGKTEAIRSSFMHRNVDDWADGEKHVLAYPRERVEEFSPYSKAILEIRSDKDLQVLQKIYANGVLLGDKSERGWGVTYAREFDMTNDSRLFPPRDNWEAKGYRPDEYGHWLLSAWQDYSGPRHILDRKPGLILSRNGTQATNIDAIEDVAVPLYEGRMINQFDFSEKGWVRGKGRSAVWRDIPFEEKLIEPQYLMARGDFIVDSEDDQKATLGLKAGFLAIGSATNSRSMFSSLIVNFPAGNSVGVLQAMDKNRTIAMMSALNSYAYDFSLRNRLGGLNLNYFVLAETPVPALNEKTLQQVVAIALRLGLPNKRFAEEWLFLRSSAKGWRSLFALTKLERLRLRAINEAMTSFQFGLQWDELHVALDQTDLPSHRLKGEQAKALNPKGFWRTDKDREPELRHTVLSLIAFHDLLENGIDAFMSRNDGEGWMIPETLRLADYGLGHDDRAKEHQPVARRLGPRFYDWQLNEDVERSWQECAAHAELVNRIIPAETTKIDDATKLRPGHQARLL